jgi:uncharacterized protein (DUF1800 family)
MKEFAAISWALGSPFRARTLAAYCIAVAIAAPPLSAGRYAYSSEIQGSQEDRDANLHDGRRGEEDRDADSHDRGRCREDGDADSHDGRRCQEDHDTDSDDVDANDAVRFLQQATFGPSFGSKRDPTSVARVREIGLEAWLDEQFRMPTLYSDGSNYADLPFVLVNPPSTCTGTCLRDNYSMYPLQLQFYRNALTGPDQLRQRVAFALSQIFVTSAQDAILNKGSWMEPYLGILDRDAFGSFRALLNDITLNPAMGQYLNTLGNVRAAPNENYGREVLQLFSIGLNQLNIDGTLQRDSHGAPIPTYDQPVVTNFARAFTGWNLAAPLGTGILNYRDPMVPNENLHDRNAKQLLQYPGAVNNGLLPANRTAEQDLEGALDNIFHHPNVGPFICNILIEHLVTSNPSPEYIARVASVFNDNGQGVRGDLQAVIRAILLDPEARDPLPSASFGHLMEPVLFITTTLRAFGVDHNSSDFVLGESFLTPGQPAPLEMGQDLFRAPSVFNYYPPGYVLSGTTLKAPEFLLFSTSTAFARTNLLYLFAYHKMTTTADRPKGTWIDLSSLEPLARKNGRQLVRLLNQRLLHGAMSDSLEDRVSKAIQAMPDSQSSDLLARVQEAVYLVATSPEYQVRR